MYNGIRLALSVNRRVGLREAEGNSQNKICGGMETPPQILFSICHSEEQSDKESPITEQIFLP
ncbi:MAG: hypothetical protein L0287_03850 [Anaerolineae bacterium]|nr:hypothetical protein [Anaerolineae bacterium]MCI0609843.1 hypothetical protein [Anaerolineae bacterium]